MEAHGMAAVILNEVATAEQLARVELDRAIDAREQNKAQRTRWLACHRDDLTRYRELDDSLTYRQRLMGQAMRWQQPDWAVAVLGPLPTSRSGERAWLTAAGVLAAYRERWDITEPDLGPLASEGRQQAHLREVTEALAELEQQRERHPTAASLPSAATYSPSADHSGTDVRGRTP
jgi:hypothetical protein